ncbi:MAG TPA: arginine deiminase-related protein [Flavisolibacter sp.]
MPEQVTDTLLMVRPASFGYNAETAANNFFQNEPPHGSDLQVTALTLFDNMVRQLRDCGLRVVVADDSSRPVKPDALFPNNWLATDAQGVVSMFPMYAFSRRHERREEIIELLRTHFEVAGVRDWSGSEADHRFLEGTGSMVMDHANRIIYACLSPRTDAGLVSSFARANGYRAVTFTACDAAGRPVYHTNVLMCVGERFAVVCHAAIKNKEERDTVTGLLRETGHELVEISLDQVQAFAGNMLQVRNITGERLILLSTTALQALTPQQMLQMEKHGRLCSFDVSIIEHVEGGSVRCMLAEIFLPPKAQAFT